MVKISDAEWKIMDLLWREGPITLTAMTRRMEQTTGWSKNVIITYLNRLREKGAVSYEQRGRAKWFSASIDQRQTAVEESRSFLDRVFRGNAGLMISTLVSEEALSPEEIEELRKALEAL